MASRVVDPEAPVPTDEEFARLLERGHRLYLGMFAVLRPDMSLLTWGAQLISGRSYDEALGTLRRLCDGEWPETRGFRHYTEVTLPAEPVLRFGVEACKREAD